MMGSMSDVRTVEEIWLDPSSQRRLSYRLWQPPAPHGLLVIVHGFGEHSGRYRPLAHALAQDGLCVAAPDLWGHGRSGGRRGDLGDVTACVEQLQRLTETVFLPASGQASYALFGHRFGALAAIQWAMSRPARLSRVVIQAPWLDLGFPVPAWKTSLGALMARWWPSCRLPTSLDARALSRDPSVVRAYLADPLVHRVISARTYRSILQSRDQALAHADTIRVPTLLLYGTDDRIISVDTARRWFERLTCEKRCVAFPGCYHELHHEPARDTVLRLVCDWALGTNQ